MPVDLGEDGDNLRVPTLRKRKAVAPMAKHAYVMYRLTINKNRYPDDFLNVGNIDSKGVDLLYLIHAFLSDISTKPLKDERFGNYLRVDKVAPRGRCIQFVTDHGRFGTTGELVDTNSGETTHEFDEDESPVARTRNMFVSPASGSSALFIAERYGGRGSASMILTQLKRAFRRRFDSDQLILKSEGLIDKDAWDEYIARADMTSIEIKKFGPSADVADQMLAKTIGKIVSTVKPTLGQRIFSRSIRDRLIGGEIDAQQMVGMSVEDTDEVEAVLNDGVQQRRLLLGQGRVPVLSYQITPDGDPRPDDGVVWRVMRDRVSELNEKLMLKLPYGWEAGSWPREALDVKLAAIRDS